MGGILFFVKSFQKERKARSNAPLPGAKRSGNSNKTFFKQSVARNGSCANHDDSMKSSLKFDARPESL